MSRALAPLHRFVCFAEIDAYLRRGWMPMPTLRDTYHGQFAVHLVAWPCVCRQGPLGVVSDD